MIKGSVAALVTPFKKNGAVDFECYGRLIDFHIKNGSDGIVVLGTTGEAPTVNDEETAALIAYAVKESGGRIPIIAGCGSNDTAKAKKRCISASRLGADAILLLTPYYNKANSRGMKEHFISCANASDIPVIMYNVPSRTGCSLTLGDIAELKEHPMIRGIKEASGNMGFFSRVCALADENFAVYCGCDEMNVPALAVGASGIISVLANVLPDKCAEMCMLMEAGELECARKIQHRYSALIAYLFSEPNPIPIKTLMNEIRLKGVGEVGDFRLPLCEMSAEAKQKLMEEWQKASGD